MQLEADIANLREISELQEARCIELNAMLGDRDQTLEISQVRTLYRTAVYFTSSYFRVHSQPHYLPDSLALILFLLPFPYMLVLYHLHCLHQDCHLDHCVTHHLLQSSPFFFDTLILDVTQDESRFLRDVLSKVGEKDEATNRHLQDVKESNSSLSESLHRATLDLQVVLRYFIAVTTFPSFLLFSPLYLFTLYFAPRIIASLF